MQNVDLQSGFDEFLAKLPTKDRVNVQKRIAAAAAVDAPADGGLLELWKRLASALFALAPFGPKAAGRPAIQYFVADGKYRMQVFALEDLQDGNVTVYCPDVLSQALEDGVIASPAPGADADHYKVASRSSSSVLCIKLLDRNTLDPAAHVKDMVGWNRRALRITLPAAATVGQIEAAESVCAIAARRFGKPADAVSGTSA